MCALLLVFVAASYMFQLNRPVYLVEFELYKPPDAYIPFVMPHSSAISGVH